MGEKASKVLYLIFLMGACALLYLGFALRSSVMFLSAGPCTGIGMIVYRVVRRSFPPTDTAMGGAFLLVWFVLVGLGMTSGSSFFPVPYLEKLGWVCVAIAALALLSCVGYSLVTRFRSRKIYQVRRTNKDNCQVWRHKR